MITWLASQPRSGNTWLRFMLAAALDIDPYDIADVQETAGKLQLRPGALNLVKTHWSLTSTMADNTTRAVLLVRHPLDVAISIAHYIKRGGSPHPLSTIIPDMIESYARAGGWCPTEAWRPFGSWSGHLCSWLDQDRFPTLVIRYEWMLADPAAALRSVLRFCGVDAVEAEIERAVESATFDKMAVRERAEIDRGEKTVLSRGVETAAPFVRRGEVGQWRDHISDPHLAAVRERRQAEMARFGYDV